MKVQGDLLVMRQLLGRRVDHKLDTHAAIAATLNLEKYSPNWQAISTDDNGAQDVVFPDATTLEKGFKFYIHNIGGVDNLAVKDDGANLLYTVKPGIAVEFVLYDNATTDGLWYVHQLTDIEPATPARYVYNFVIADFPAAAGGYHVLSLAQATHGRGLYPMLNLFEKIGTDHDAIMADRLRVASNGDVSIRVTADDSESPSVDGRFDGRLILM